MRLHAGLGDVHCENVRGAGSADMNDTCVWDYSGCKGTNTMRSVTQHICVAYIDMRYLAPTSYLRVGMVASSLQYCP
jgi:hypothetical protein